MGTTADDLRQQVDANRSSAEEKLNMLEQQVTDSAQMIQDKVTGSASMIQEKVADTAQQIKQSFDWRKQVDDRPLVAVGVAMVGGMLLGKMTSGGSGGGHHAPDIGRGAAGGGMIAMAMQNAMQKSGLADTMETTMHDLFSTASTRLKDLAKDMPGMSSGGGGNSGDSTHAGGTNMGNTGSSGFTGSGGTGTSGSDGSGLGSSGSGGIGSSVGSDITSSRRGMEDVTNQTYDPGELNNSPS